MDPTASTLSAGTVARKPSMPLSCPCGSAPSARRPSATELSVPGLTRTSTCVGGAGGVLAPATASPTRPACIATSDTARIPANQRPRRSRFFPGAPERIVAWLIAAPPPSCSGDGGFAIGSSPAQATKYRPTDQSPSDDSTPFCGVGRHFGRDVGKLEEN